MIEINLIKQKKQFEMPVVLGIDFAEINIKMLAVALIIFLLSVNHSFVVVCVFCSDIIIHRLF